MDESSFVVLLEFLVKVYDSDEGDGLGAKNGSDKENKDEEHVVRGGEDMRVCVCAVRRCLLGASSTSF